MLVDFFPVTTNIYLVINLQWARLLLFLIPGKYKLIFNRGKKKQVNNAVERIAKPNWLCYSENSLFNSHLWNHSNYWPKYESRKKTCQDLICFGLTKAILSWLFPKILLLFTHNTSKINCISLTNSKTNLVTGKRNTCFNEGPHSTVCFFIIIF